MRSIGLFIFLLFFSVGAGAGAAASAEVEAENFVRAQVKEVLRISRLPDIDERYVQMRRLINRIVAIPPATHFILGQHWRSLEKNDQQAYQEAFRRYFLVYFMDFSGLNMVDVAVDRARPGEGTDMFVEGRVVQKDFSMPTPEEKAEMTPKEKMEVQKKSREHLASGLMLDMAKSDSSSVVQHLTSKFLSGEAESDSSSSKTVDVEFWLKARLSTYAVFDIRILGKSALVMIRNSYNPVLRANMNDAALALDDFILEVENKEALLTRQGLDPKLVPRQKKLKMISIQVPTAAPAEEEAASAAEEEKEEAPASPAEPEKRKRKTEGPVLKRISIPPAPGGGAPSL